MKFFWEIYKMSTRCLVMSSGDDSKFGKAYLQFEFASNG